MKFLKKGVNRYEKRMLSLLTVTLFFISAVCPVMASDDVNLIVNGGFETGDHTGWSAFNSAIIDTTSPHTGTYCAKVDKNSSYEQTVSLAPNTKYVLTGWAKSENSAVMTLGVKNYGGQESFSATVSAEYQKLTVTFVTNNEPCVVSSSPILKRVSRCQSV